ncbi:Hsp20/alpha crystallin family protein [Methanoregula formicica]|uniref:Molecular chaperone (Small heat shock protein) n=1 Tax=Methanoregula formicica (strain DSM 22288 / NBRC 105244 / SMSP) TaxID=593750 RepID=L0HDN6_METFS|nr:Hsp20/alpha crystallin family protein [Methanoregula formicica]AGB02125.1 molecular chaperone (small heat shock protein) [Methanoregula formicica SMSP]
MVWRRYPIDSIWHEMDEMREEIDSLFRQMSERGRLLPAGGMSDRMLPAIRGEFRVDVREHDNDVIVVADLPGVDKEAVSLQLVNPRAIEISCERSDEREEKGKGFYMRERMSGSMRRIVALPTDVTDKDARASFRNGVLEVTLKKTKDAKKSRIAIE